MIFFHIPAQNIDCGYSLEPPRRGGSNEYPQYMFLSRYKKNNVYPCKPQFYYIKMGFKGDKIIQAWFRDANQQSCPEIIKLFSGSTQLSMKFVLLVNLKLLTFENSFLLLLAFSYLLAEKISCSPELSMKKTFITPHPDLSAWRNVSSLAIKNVLSEDFDQTT